MRKIILIFAFILATQVSVDAQNRRRHPRRQIDRVERRMERQEWHIDRVTDAMALTYELTDKQKEQVRALNANWLGQNRSYRYNDARNRKQLRRYPCYTEDNACVGTPTLYKELRLKELESEVESYRAELQKIFTKKQYKAYEKQVEEALAQASLNK